MKLSVALMLGVAAFADLAAAGGFKDSCKSDWYLDGSHLVANCRRSDGSYLRSRQDMNLCIGYYKSSGLLTGQDGGNAWSGCINMRKEGSGSIKGSCKTRNGAGIWLESTLDINAFTTNDNGYLWCYGHRSAPF
ncbi:hypothetical protein QBC43DRAFT_283292 [Cladorrhinum sp. PSN259]|nr:hypothetical protein QBC43DRAFT_283292 [Cladorrhinum sp. PSN259]